LTCLARSAILIDVAAALREWETGSTSQRCLAPLPYEERFVPMRALRHDWPRGSARRATAVLVGLCGLAGAMVLPQTGLGAPAAVKSPLYAYYEVVGGLGYVAGRDGEAMVLRPYDKAVVATIVTRLGDEALELRMRFKYVLMLIRLARAWPIPGDDLTGIVRPAVAEAVKAAETAADRAQQDRHLARMVAELKLCQWNVEYGIAWAALGKAREGHDAAAMARARARLAELEALAMERARPTKMNYLGDLLAWYLVADLETATRKVAAVAKVERRDWRVDVAQAKIRIRRRLSECEDDDARVEALIAAVGDGNNPIPVQCWAVRRLTDYPTPECVRFLQDLFDTAKAKGRAELGQEAQEALKRLKRLPPGVHRYAFV